MAVRDTRKAELKKILKTIDEDLVREQFPLEGRQTHALLRLSQRLKTKIASHPDDELYQFVMSWYEKKYGSRVKAARTIGDLAILIRGGLYKMTIPLIRGQAQIVVDPNVETKRRVQKSEAPDPDVVYVLNLIEKLTLEQARKLSPLELKELMLYFSWGLGAFQSINLFSGSPLTREAVADLRSAVDHLFREEPPACGKSKSASFQAAEKFIKGYIASRGGRADKQHGLPELVSDAYSLGLRPLNPDNLEVLMPDSRVSPGEAAVPVEEAVEAHHASIDICANVASSARR
jgi:HEPN domain-containing protein